MNVYRYVCYVQCHVYMNVCYVPWYVKVEVLVKSLD